MDTEKRLSSSDRSISGVLDASSDFCVSAHKLPCVALDTFTQCNGFRGVLLDGWLARKPLGLLDRTAVRPFAPNDNVGSGGGAALTTVPLLGKVFEEFLGGGPGGGGGGRVTDGFCEALLAPASFGGGNGGTGGAGTQDDMVCNGGGGGGG